MSSNPMFKTQNFSSNGENIALESKPMTAQGAVNKTLILLGIVVVSAIYTWFLTSNGYYDKALLFIKAGAIAGFVLAIVTAFKPQYSNMTAPAYAICEGFALGGISKIYASMYEGIVINAIGITVLALFSMLALYKARVIQATPLFKKIIFTSTLAIGIFYLVGFIASLLGHSMTIFNGGIVGIIISLVFCAIAAFNFIIDFDFIENGEKNLLPCHYEWYGAFSLLVTLIWLYLEVLKLLAQLNKRR